MTTPVRSLDSPEREQMVRLCGEGCRQSDLAQLFRCSSCDIEEVTLTDADLDLLASGGS